MAAKKSTDVMIAGKIYTLSGYEEEGYLQRVAGYINTKISEIEERVEYRRIPADMRSILIQLNIADDYFKIRGQFDSMDENFKKAEKELFDLKHELVDTQMKVDQLESDLSKEKKKARGKSDNEKEWEKKYQKLEETHQSVLDNARILEEKVRQYEEASIDKEEKTKQLEEQLRQSQEEKRSLELEIQELRLNKKKLEKTLEDALLGAIQSDEEKQAEEVQERPMQDPGPQITELSEEDDPELQELARQIAQLEKEERYSHK